MIELKQTETEQVQEALEKDEEIKNNSVTVEVDEVYKDKKDIKSGRWLLFFYNAALCCNVCKENCHYPCTMALRAKDCEIIQKGCCTVCTGKCPVSAHVKEGWIYEIKTRKIKKTIQVEKQGKDKEPVTQNKYLNQLEQLKTQKAQVINEAYQHIIKLEEIALNIYSQGTYDNLIFLIEKMKEIGETEKVKKLEEIKSRLDGETRSAVENVR